MATSYNAKSVKCPFYKEDKRNTIKCEGTIPDSNSINTFIRHDDKKIQMALFCEKSFEKCEQFRAVMSTRYEN